MCQAPWFLWLIPLFCIPFFLISQYQSTHNIAFWKSSVGFHISPLSVENNRSIQNKTDSSANVSIFIDVWKEYLGSNYSIDLDCQGLAENNKNAFIDYFKLTGRITVKKEPALSMNCNDIRKRILRLHDNLQLNNSYAVARNAYEDYYLQEILLAQTYSPSNGYCYALDKKSSVYFKNSMNKMASCLPNVIILDEKLLNASEWKYVFLLQNADAFIKNPFEISTIIGMLKGAPLFAPTNPFKSRVPKATITAKSMQLFLNEKNKAKDQMETMFTIRKSLVEMALPREFVLDMVNYLNLTTILDAFNDNKTYGIDEYLFSTLASANFLGLRGQVHNRCNFDETVRYTDWNYGNPQTCKSHEKRHSVCLLGMEYMPVLRDAPVTIANKVWPEFDFGTLMCIDEMFHGKKNTRREWKKITEFYASIPHVREYKLKEEGNFNISTFKC